MATAVVFFATVVFAADAFGADTFAADTFAATFLAASGFAFAVAVAVADAARAGFTDFVAAGLAAAEETFAVAFPAAVFALDVFAVLEVDPDADFFAMAMVVPLLHSFSV